jgi:diguanylate cyclase (GGDEF)-like protein
MNHKLSTILFVEDEPEVRFELKRFLQRYSSNVITADNGEEGLQLFKKYTPDIVISDIKMPKMNGIDMAKAIKKLVPSQTIIFTTAHSDNSYFLEAIEMQVDGYILKPVDLGLLKKKINDFNKNIVLKREKRLYESILDDIAQMQDIMLAVYDQNRLPVFYNKKLLSFLGYKSLQIFLTEYHALSKKFENNEDCYYSEKQNEVEWLEEIKDIEVDKRIVSMRGTDMLESKFFLVSLSDKTQSNNIIVTFSEVTSIVEKKQQYKQDAYTDELTQIDNRARFNILFDKAIETSKEKQIPLSIVLLDIDNFKHVNDCHGHVVGDNVLKLFTALILDNIRVEDSFSRWGGEEFVLLLSDTALKNAKDIAENLRGVIENYDFGIDKKLTCSFGVTIGNEGDTSGSLFERVDKALYKAKNGGRNRVVVSE